MIDLKEWNVDYTEFTKWVTENNADVYAISYQGASTPTTSRFYFEKEEDFVVFKLTFGKHGNTSNV